MGNKPAYHNPRKKTHITHNRLPHWEQGKSTYFITFRLADSIPAEALRSYMDQKRAFLKDAPARPWPDKIESEYRKRFTGRFELWLDRGHGSCILKDTTNAKIVRNSLEYFEGDRYTLHSWVIMPNHVHVLASLRETSSLSKILHTWKGYSARQINKHLNHSGPVWQKSYFDRSIRNLDHFTQCARYIRKNPSKAGIMEGSYLHDESEYVRMILA